MAGDTWNIVAALAAAGGTFTAAFAIWQSSARAKAQSLADKVSLIRKNLSLYKAFSDALLKSLQHETVLAIGEGISQSFFRYFKVDNVDQLNAALDELNEHPSLLVRWVAEDPVTDKFRQKYVDVQATSSVLGIQLPIFLYITEIFGFIFDDALSENFFFKFLDIIHSTIPKYVSADATAVEIQAYMGKTLSGDAMGYFQVRYPTACKCIGELVDILFSLHLTLEDKILNKISIEFRNTPRKEDVIQDILEYLHKLRRFIDQPNYDSLVDVKKKIEAEMSKEEARKKNEAIHSAS